MCLCSHNNLPLIAQLVRSQTGIQPQAAWLRNPPCSRLCSGCLGPLASSSSCVSQAMRLATKEGIRSKGSSFPHKALAVLDSRTLDLLGFIKNHHGAVSACAYVCAHAEERHPFSIMTRQRYLLLMNHISVL